MTRFYRILVVLATLIAVSSAADWLEGGSVGRGNYGEVRQYFTDPIFYSPSSHYTSSDPAVRQMEESMDRYSSRYSSHYASSDPAIRQMEESMDRYSSRYASLGSQSAKSNIGKATSGSASAAVNQPLGAAGGWHMELSEGISIDLDLHQSGSRVFGTGSMASSTSTQWAMASGEVTGSSLRLDIIPASGVELYAVSLDISRLHMPGSYTAFRAYAAQSSGNVKANRD